MYATLTRSALDAAGCNSLPVCLCVCACVFAAVSFIAFITFLVQFAYFCTFLTKKNKEITLEFFRFCFSLIMFFCCCFCMCFRL